jgi:hypothetical protein
LFHVKHSFGLVLRAVVKSALQRRLTTFRNRRNVFSPSWPFTPTPHHQPSIPSPKTNDSVKYSPAASLRLRTTHHYGWLRDKYCTLRIRRPLLESSMAFRAARQTKQAIGAGRIQAQLQLQPHTRRCCGLLYFHRTAAPLQPSSLLPASGCFTAGHE